MRRRTLLPSAAAPKFFRFEGKERRRHVAGRPPHSFCVTPKIFSARVDRQREEERSAPCRGERSHFSTVAPNKIERAATRLGGRSYFLIVTRR